MTFETYSEMDDGQVDLVERLHEFMVNQYGVDPDNVEVLPSGGGGALEARVRVGEGVGRLD